MPDEVYLAWRVRHQDWKREEDAIYNLARDDVQGMAWFVRQHYNLLQTDSRYLALDDIDMRREFHGLVLDAYRKKHGTLPERTFSDFGDMLSMVARGIIPELISEEDFIPVDPDKI